MGEEAIVWATTSDQLLDCTIFWPDSQGFAVLETRVGYKLNVLKCARPIHCWGYTSNLERGYCLLTVLIKANITYSSQLVVEVSADKGVASSHLVRTITWFRLVARQHLPINLLEDTSVRSIWGDGQGCVWGWECARECVRECVRVGVCEGGSEWGWEVEQELERGTLYII